MKGYDTSEIVDKLAGDDAQKRNRVSAQIAIMIQRDPATQEILGQISKGLLIMDLGAASRALGRRAAKGNIPAIKLLFESSGFWSPRSVQEHTGEIAITLKGVTRPAVTEDEVVDATVVEE